MSTTKPAPALYSPEYFEEEKKNQGTPAQQAAADALIRARNATRASARRHKQACNRADTLAQLAAQAEVERNEVFAEHEANLDAQRLAHKAACEAKARPADLPGYYENAATV